MPLIEVQGFGRFEFPDDMSQEDIKAALDKEFYNNPKNGLIGVEDKFTKPAQPVNDSESTPEPVVKPKQYGIQSAPIANEISDFLRTSKPVRPGVRHESIQTSGGIEPGTISGDQHPEDRSFLDQATQNRQQNEAAGVLPVSPLRTENLETTKQPAKLSANGEDSPFKQFLDKTFGGEGKVTPEQSAKALVEFEAGRKGMTAKQYKEQYGARIGLLERGLKDFGSGAISSGGGMLQYLSRMDGSAGMRKLTDKIMQHADDLMPSDPNFVDQLVAGFGSTAAFFVPGIGIAKGTESAYKLAPRMALWLGAGASGGLEAAAEAGGVYQTMLGQGKSPAEAAKAADTAFWQNAFLVTVTDRFGLFGDRGTRMMRRTLAGVNEGVLQEGGQQIISNILTGKPWHEGVPTSMAIGAIVGTTLGGNVNTPVENLAQEFDSNIKQANIPESYTDKFVRDLLNPSNAQVKATPPETRAPKYGLDTRKPMKPAETDVYYENTLDDARKRQAEEDAAYQQKQAEEAAVKSQDEPKVEKALTKKQKREQFQKEREYGLMLEAKKEGQTAVADLEVKQSIEAEENQQPTAMGLALKAAIQKKGGVEFPKADEVKPEINSEMDKSAHAAATSPTNNLPEPTLAQKEAGNYKKGHHTLQGLDITIENPQGSTRSGVSQDGKAWSSTLRSHYGYIKRSLGNDGDQVDVFLGKDAETAPNVFVVNQVDPETGKFDEHKVMIGYGDQYKARKAYLDNYEKGWKGLESIQKMSMPEFKSWLKTGNTQAPVMPEDVRAISKRLKAEKKQKMLSSDRNPNPKTDELKVAIAKLGGLNRSEAKSQGIDPANFTISGHKIKRVFTEEGMSFDEMAESLAQHGYPVFDEKGNYSPNALLDSLEKSIVGEKIMATVGHENLAAASEPEQDPFEARYGAWAEQKTTEDKLAWLMAAHGEDRIDEARERVAIQFPDVSDAEFNGRLIATLRGETYEENDAGRNKDDAGAGESHGAGEEARQGNYRQAAKTGTTDAEIDDIPFSRKRDDEESGPQQSVATKHADQKSRIWFPRFASPELKARVKEHAGTNWAREVKRSFVFRHEIQQLAEGNMSLGEALALTSTRGGELVHTKLAKMLSEKGWEGAWEYIEKDVHVIGGASKPAMAVNSSFVNCNPSKACAKFCYAAQGMPTYPAAKAKQELLDVLAERDPARLADIIAKDFKSADKAGRAWRDTALRLFDVGDGNEAWVKVVKQLNKRGIRVHVFSKNPDFLMKLDKRNIRLLSVDGSNAHLAEGNDLPLSIVYTGIKDLPLLQKYQHRIDSGEGGVILPEDSALKGDDIEAIPDDLARFVCPFDKGKKKTWSCLSCDNGKGIGCYADSITHNEHFGGVRSIKRTLDKHTRRVEKEDLSHAELDELEDHFRKQLEAIKRLRAEAARRAGEAGDRGDLSREGAEARTNQQEVEENKGLYAGYERETGNVSERKRGEGVSQESADAGQGQMSLFDTDGLPEAEAKTQVKDNFLVHYHQVATTYFRSGIDTINTPEEAAHVVAPLRKHAQESMLAVVTDKDGKILNVIRHTKGTKDGSTVEPVIVAGAIASTNGAKNVWFAHNHPSGVVDPSQADINITGKLKDALDATGIKVKGHIIVGSGMNAWHFTTKRGALGGVAEHSPIKIHAKPRKHSIGLTERVIKKNAQNGRPAITSPDSAIDVVSEMDADNAIVLLDNRHQLAGSISMTPDEMMSLREGGRVNRILKAIDSTNATATLVVSTDHGAARNVARYLNGIGGIRVLDAIIKDNGKYTASSSNGLMIESDKGPFFMRNRESGNNPAQAKQGASGDKQRRIERLRWEISKYLKEPLAEDHFEAVQVPDALAGAIEAIEKTFQQPVTIFRNHNPKRFDFDGVMLRGENGGIYVNVNNKNPVVSIVGHELLHAMRREHPDLYQQLYDAAYPEMRGIEKYREWLDAAHEKEGYAPVSDSILHEEILGDFMGDQFMEPEFWRKVGEHNPSLLKRVYVAIRKFLSDTLKRARTLGSAQYFKEIEKVQDTLAEVVSEFADRATVQTLTESSNSGQPLFSRRRHDASWTVPDENLKDRFARKIQDKFQHIFMLQNTIRASGGHIDMNSDVYAAEERMHGKIEQDLLHLEEDYIEPIAQKLSEYDIDMENIDTYLIAKHAQERNEYIASIRDDMPDGGSGMTTREARGIVQTIENSPKAQQYRELAALVYNMLAHKRDVLRRSGLMSVDAVDQWRDNYQYYVPLKGWAEDAINDSFPRIGKGLSIKGKESKKAAGRRSLAYSPAVQSIQDITESFIRGWKNEVGQHMLRLAMENPNPAYWQIFTEDNPDIEMRNVNGKVRATTVAMHSSTKYFGVKVDGKQYYIKMLDPRLERAVNNLGIEKVNSVIKVLGSVNRFLSSVNTSLNPEFVLSNFMRDIQTAIYNVLAEQDLHDAKIGGEHIQGKMIRDVPASLRAIYRGLRGRGGTGEFDQYFQDFLADGAKTGYFDSRSLEQQKDHVLALIKMNRKGVGSKAEKVARDAMKFIEDVNTAVENGVRLSAYINARKALESRGVSEDVARKKAAHLSKNLTVNFNRRGEWSTVANSLYMFFNASVQGSAQFARTVLTAKKTNGRSLPIIGQYRPNTAQKMAIGMFLLAIALAELNRAASDDDKDGSSVYDNIPGHIKERNIIIMKSIFGGKGDEYWTIPLPYGYNIFHVLGTTIDDVVSGPKEKLDGATDIMQAVLGSFNPIGMSDSDNPGITILKTLTPTILTPGVELTANENFFGGPIYREDKYNSRTPDSSLSMSTTKEHYKIFSQWLNEVTGGNMYERGYVDISPDSIEHWAEFFTGGTGRFIDKSVSAATKVANAVPLRDREIPFWRKISGQRDEYFQERSYYDRRDIALAKLEAFDAARGVDRLQYRMENGNWLQLANLSKAYDKRLKRYRKKLHAVRDDDSLDMKTKDEKMREYRAKMEKIYGQFNTKYYELIEQRGKSIHQDNEPE